MMLSHNKQIDDYAHNQPNPPSNDAAAELIRNKIDQIFNEETSEITPKNPEAKRSISSHNLKNHQQNSPSHTNDWNQYHTAWQNYYQKYYEGYYKQNSKKSDSYFTQQPEQSKVLTNKEATSEIKSQLVQKVQKSAKNIRRSRHFIPLFAGFVVVTIFMFLQYNQFLIANVMAYVSPGNIDPQNIVIDPNANLVVGSDPRLIIPKINVDVPVLYDVGNDYTSQMAAMSKGVAQFAIPGASSHPGQIGNTVIAGHSSNDLLDTGDYKFIFAQLDKLEIGDTIYANYQSKRYTYTVTKKEVVKPSEVSKLVYPTDKPILTVLTCTPLGTAINRLLVTAEQVSPDPSQSVTAPTVSSTNTSSIPGSTPTFFERLFGAK
jgi:sortase A